MFVQSFEHSDRRIIVTGKYSIERDLLFAVKKLIHDCISNIAFEITIQYKIFIDWNSICLQSDLYPASRRTKSSWSMGPRKKQYLALPMDTDQMIHQAAG